MQNLETSVAEELRRIDEALRASSTATVDMSESFVRRHPDNIDGWIFLGRARQMRGQFGPLMDVARRIEALDPKHGLGRTLMIDALYRSGQMEAAFQAARTLENEKKLDADILSEVAGFYRQTSRFRDAARCLERVRILQPTNLHALHALAACYAALGDLDKTEGIFNAMLRRAPHEYEAYYNRSALRKQKPESNHVADIEAILRTPLQTAGAESVLCYALAKELEDLKEWSRSFSYLKRGADSQRRTITYDVQFDLDYLRLHEQTFDEAFFRQPRPGYRARRPVFVLGMPRSGTTLVDRILSSHSKVGSVGESSEFTVAVLRQSSRTDRGEVSLDRARDLDYAHLGWDYCAAVDGLLPGIEHVLDKTPPNFYHLGQIAVALPEAPIVHLRRNPVANCYAIYKTLFRGGYAYSYNLVELGRFYLGYLELMAHWRRVLPGRFLDVDYEELVKNQEEMTRRMIAFCGLDWEDACLSFEKNDSPTMTASVSQVRQPIYDSSIDQWRNYEKELAPLIRLFEDAGVKVD